MGGMREVKEKQELPSSKRLVKVNFSIRQNQLDRLRKSKTYELSISAHMRRAIDYYFSGLAAADREGENDTQGI